MDILSIFHICANIYFLLLFMSVYVDIEYDNKINFVLNVRIYILLQNETLDFIETCYMLFYMLICIIPVLMQKNAFCTDFCFNERVMISKCMFQVGSEWIYVSIRKLQCIKVL